MQRTTVQSRPWTAEAKALLNQLWNVEQLDYHAIALRLDRTESAVMGQVWRMGWQSPRHRPAWTPQRDDLLERLWKRDGLTYTAIGEQLGCSRNAVIGRVARLGWQNQGAPRAPVVRVPQQQVPRPRPPKPGPGPVASPNAKPWTERGPRECPYPVKPDGADTLSCCNPTGGFAYCPGHYAVMHPPLVA
jgi:GcrA cell cycle regulator